MQYTFREETQGLNAALIYAVTPDDELDTMSVEMLARNNVPGLVSLSSSSMDGTVSLRYNVTGLKKLSSVFAGIVSRNLLLGCLLNICDVYETMANYMLDENTLLLEPDKMYFQPQTGRVLLVCLPLANISGQPTLHDFVRQIMFTTRFDPSEDCSHVAQIINYLNSTGSFTAHELRAMVQRLMTPPAYAAPRPAAPVPPRPAAPMQPVAPVAPVQQSAAPVPPRPAAPAAHAPQPAAPVPPRPVTPVQPTAPRPVVPVTPAAPFTPPKPAAAPSAPAFAMPGKPAAAPSAPGFAMPGKPAAAPSAPGFAVPGAPAAPAVPLEGMSPKERKKWEKEQAKLEKQHAKEEKAAAKAEKGHHGLFGRKKEEPEVPEVLPGTPSGMPVPGVRRPNYAPASRRAQLNQAGNAYNYGAPAAPVQPAAPAQPPAPPRPVAPVQPVAPVAPVQQPGISPRPVMPAVSVQPPVPPRPVMPAAPVQPPMPMAGGAGYCTVTIMAPNAAPMADEPQDQADGTMFPDDDNTMLQMESDATELAGASVQTARRAWIRCRATGEATQVSKCLFVLGRYGEPKHRPDGSVDYPADCTVRTADRGISRRHATVLYYAGRFYLADISSRHETYLNGMLTEHEDHAQLDMPPITFTRAYPLKNGDIIRLRSEEFQFEEG